jgi:hypothetical protein
MLARITTADKLLDTLIDTSRVHWLINPLAKQGILGMKQDMAETRALGVLGWLLGQDELLPVFLGAGGVTEADLRRRAGEPEFLASVIDFVLLDDAWVIDCATALGWPPETVPDIRAALPGGDLPNWT